MEEKTTRIKRVANCRNGFRLTARAEMSEPVDPCDFEGVQARLDQDWYFVRVVPGEEFAVIARLRRMPVPMFAATPVREEWDYWTKFQKKKVCRQFANMPGYIAIAQSPAFHRWVALIECAGVVGPLTHLGRNAPYRIEPEIVKWFTHDLSSEAPDLTPVEEIPEPTFEVGGRVVVSNPHSPFSGIMGAATGLVGDKATVMLEILGGLQEVKFPITSLAPAQ